MAHIWIISEDEQYLAHIWHKKYSVPETETKYLGRFACKKLSKMTCIPSAERHWKQAKRHKKGNKGQGEDLDRKDDDDVYHFHGRRVREE